MMFLNCCLTNFTAASAEPFEDGFKGLLNSCFIPCLFSRLFTCSFLNWVEPSVLNRDGVGIMDRNVCRNFIVSVAVSVFSGEHTM